MSNLFFIIALVLAFIAAFIGLLDHPYASRVSFLAAAFFFYLLSQYHG